jgi:hypothetical protein
VTITHGVPAVQQDWRMAAGLSGRAMATVPPVGRGPLQVDSIPAIELEGVRIIHRIPAGLACVRDEAVRTMKTGESFEELLFAEYKDADVALDLADTNDLLPDEDGNLSVYVPPGDPVIIPEMCYPKDGADAVTLQSTGEPEQAMSGGAVLAGIIVIGLGIAALMLLWKRLSASAKAAGQKKSGS